MTGAWKISWIKSRLVFLIKEELLNFNVCLILQLDFELLIHVHVNIFFKLVVELQMIIIFIAGNIEVIHVIFLL